MRPDALWPSARTETWIQAPARVFEDHGPIGVIRTASNPTYRWGNCLVLPTPPTPDALDELEATHARLLGTDTPAFLWPGDAVDPALAAAFTARNYQTEIEVPMRMGLAGEPPPALPDGVTVTPVSSVADWADFARFRVLLWPKLPLDYQFQRASMAWQSAQANAGAWWLLRLHGEVIGSMGLFWKDGLARYQDVDVRPDHHGKGLGRLMFHTVRGRSEATGGFDTQIIVADRGALAHAWYGRMGFQELTGELFAFRKAAATMASANRSAAPFE